MLKKQKAIVETERKILSESVQYLRYNLSGALFMKFGSSSEKYYKLFKISKNDAVHMQKLHDCNTDVENFKIQNNIRPNCDDTKNLSNDVQKDKIKDICDESATKTDKSEDKTEDIFKNGTKSKRKYIRNRNPKNRVRTACGGRQKFDSQLERNVVSELDLEMKCPVCGSDLKYIGPIGMDSEYLKLKEKFFTIEQYFQYKFVCKKCNKEYIKDLDMHGVSDKTSGIIVTPPQNRFIQKGIVDDNIVADTAISKFEAGIPNTRQE